MLPVARSAVSTVWSRRGRAIVLEESYLESTIRWHLYRRWKWRRSPKRVGERIFHAAVRSSPKGGLFVDCGANVGDITAAALRYGMRVIAFEPDLDALAVLRERHGSDNRVTIIPKAVGNSDRVADFHQSAEVQTGNLRSTEASSMIPTGNNRGRVRQVEVVDIVKFLRSLDEPVSILKMDIEGAEVECVEALLDAGLVGEIGQIIVETHERFSQELSEATAALRRRLADEKIGNVNLDWI